MTASRIEYMKDLLDDIGEVMNDFEGYENDRTIIAALIVADAMNGLRKGILQNMTQPPKRGTSELHKT
jgi:hypothetical protein